MAVSISDVRTTIDIVMSDVRTTIDIRSNPYNVIPPNSLQGVAAAVVAAEAEA